MTGMHIPTDGPEIKGGREPYMKLYVDDWLGGVRGLTYELQGFYLQILILMRERSGGIPNDIDALAEHLKDDRRTTRRMVDALVAKGKLVLVGEQLINPRLQRDLLREQLVSNRQSKIARRPRKALGEFGETLDQSPGKVGQKSGEKCAAQSMKSTTCASLPDPDPDPEKKEGTDVPSAVDAEAPTGKGKRRCLMDTQSVQTAYDEYNALALRVGIPQAAYLTPKRKSSINARLRECGGLDGWRKALANLEGAERLRNMPSGWVPNLDFVVQRSSFAKLLEGAYNGAPRPAAVDVLRPAPLSPRRARTLEAWREMGFAQ